MESLNDLIWNDEEEGGVDPASVTDEWLIKYCMVIFSCDTEMSPGCQSQPPLPPFGNDC